MPDQKLKEEIDRLIISGEIQYESGLIGCCINYYLKFPNDSHKYYYKRDKLIYNTLNKKVLSHLYTMSKKPVNTKTTISADKDDNKDTRHTIQIIYEITTTDTDGLKTEREYDSKVFVAYGGKQQIRKAIKTTSKDIYEYLDGSYDWVLSDFKIKRIFIDTIKKDVTDF